jgi:tRNA modification GTPase
MRRAIVEAAIMTTDTIAALATPFGPGAIAVLRLSGPQAGEVGAKALRKFQAAKAQANSVARDAVLDANGAVIDDVLVTWFQGPRSYTGEDVLEISAHGGVLVTRKVLECLLRCGARSADPGEFTQRAFLNGKMDLTQAEAVMDVISAQTDLALRAAQVQLEGRIGEETEGLRQEVLGIVAHVEAYIDFPDEDIDPDTGKALVDRLVQAEARIGALLDTAEQGRILREGVRTVIIGTPNVGKSSLLNRLLGYERAIVSETPGTTRDTVEEVVNIGGIPVRLIDTAGLRESSDEIEQRGMARARAQVETADLVIEVCDASLPPGDRETLNCPHQLLVLNKSDLPEDPAWAGVAGLRISCSSGEGVEGLVEAVRTELSFGQGSWGQEAVAINSRHQACLRRAAQGLQAGRDQMAGGASIEFAALDLREGLDAIGEVAGRVDADEILGEIFGNFCIGK